jgi:hypothetical protein
MKQENIQYSKLISCKMLRRCLKDIKATKYNENIPYIRRKLTGISPERLFHHEIKLSYIYFDKAVSAFNNLMMSSRSNMRYYPYFIFKIIEMILHRADDKKRLDSIVESIHFQRDNTLVHNDRLWSKICEIVPEFVFKKTDKDILQNV